MDIIHIAKAAEVANEAAQAGPVQLFGLNWKLFLAQLINFSVVLFVLWKWVFRPVAKGLADRTTKIENSLAEAERIAAERETFDSWKDKEMAQVRQEANQIIVEAKAAAEKGAKNSVVMLDDLAVVVDVRDRKVVTAIQAQQGKERVFTNIDSVVIA